MNARNLEFSGDGFSDFALVSAEHPDPVRQLRESEAATAARARLDDAPGRLFAGDSYRVAEIRATTLSEAAVPFDVRRMAGPEACAAFFNSTVRVHPFFDPEKECVITLLLNRRGALRAWHFATLGTQNSCVVHPREILRMALIANASAFVLMHSHPSGDPSPSTADVNVTRQVREAAHAVDVGFHDHVIAGMPHQDPAGVGFYSFKQAGLI
jgi:DNA repair protein RadC